jgi:hypothetical protein
MRAFAAICGILVILAVQTPQPAHAIGCISGGAMGAIAGHQVHHGFVGAVSGCVAGHYAHKHAVQAKADADAHAAAPLQTPADGTNPAPTSPATTPTHP